MTQSDGQLRAQAFEAYENVRSLDAHGELTRLILAELSLLTEKYRLVRRHDIPHIRELAGLLDLFWQAVEEEAAAARPEAAAATESPPLFRPPPQAADGPAEEEAPHRPVFHLIDYAGH